ncbi:hypothetical protein BN7_4804 [Wickerhamomyces ciferrii]|uniref:Uncharacterized protein n=1 Tax=Wickerhamomyces ciferrii (strain ATCC 14091 / BCRC 22168 / CBS 111 / JCM 3599 / NBRC 0793 / NRRL Y-1031 F-60-10) TaxID=1206466 RepID=K0KVR0_WICCF|nr:uncharacterized protein BN7_4804 [Wickerhamomyces ciferrii]CCH45223.1 hypothetical protein BN7_4804 [Wickerhamomyces ciferrii]
MGEVEKLEWIDLYDGLEHHQIKKSNLRFIGLNQTEFDKVERLTNESFDAAVTKIRDKRKEKHKNEELETMKSSQARISLQFPLMMPLPPDPNTAANSLPISIPQFNNETDLDTEKPEGIEETKDKDKDGDLSIPRYLPCPSSANFPPPSSEFNEIQSDDNTHKYSFTSTNNNTLTRITQEQTQIFEAPRSSSPFTDSSIISTRSTKRMKYESNISSDHFRPISSDVQILTSDKILEF